MDLATKRRAMANGSTRFADAGGRNRTWSIIVPSVGRAKTLLIHGIVACVESVGRIETCRARAVVDCLGMLPGTCEWK